jgi:hypothetical protein
MDSQDYISHYFTKEELNQPIQSPHSGENWSEESLLKASGLGRRDFEYTHVVFLRQSLKAKFCLFFEYRESSNCVIFHLLLKLDDFVCNNDVSQVIERLLKDVPQDHLLVFFCGTEGDCLLHQELIVNKKLNYEKKHGNMKANKAIKRPREQIQPARSMG